MTTDTKELIRTIRQNHIFMIASIDSILKELAVSQTLTRKEYLSLRPEYRSLQGAILNHFQIQNAAFYQNLNEQAQGEEDQKALRFLIQDLKELKVRTLMLADEHPADMGDVTPKNFKHDFTDYIQALIGRLRNEEKLLLPILEKIT